LNQLVPKFDCVAGRCTDPLQVPQGGIPVGTPMDMATHQVRIVFEKVPASDIEVPAPAGSTYPFVLKPNILAVTGPGGTPVPGDAYLDLSGPPKETSDPVLSPFGPALVFHSSGSLAPTTTYTIQLNADMIQDRQENPISNQAGEILTGMRTWTFTTAAAGLR